MMKRYPLLFGNADSMIKKWLSLSLIKLLLLLVELEPNVE